MCLHVKCVCHSLALCVQNAAGKLPSTIAFLLTEIPAWFSNSDLRRENFKEIFNTINPEDDSVPGVTTPLPFEKLSTTRWLVRGKVMNNILVNWHELKAYFEAADNPKRYQTRYKARGLNLDTENFWIGLRENNSFVDLANYALTCLTTPVSNATVERIFSLVTNVKTKPRNRLQLHTLDAIVRIRSDMVLSNKCCKQFTVTQNMLRRWTSENMYGYESKTTPVPCTSSSSTSVTEETCEEDISMFI
ncbi:hypothetical protein RRG08_013957 [Elysia crispata]|uniref:HAT C-terminal dimerisation domain-containing protein n=1 Tax=Elysia crispata TaxID=231223 RepID=A0AAE1D487_9GAST|nr:hypothetical protein RRG08_013957 [Elysia crispata]